VTNRVESAACQVSPANGGMSPLEMVLPGQPTAATCLVKVVVVTVAAYYAGRAGYNYQQAHHMGGLDGGQQDRSLPAGVAGSTLSAPELLDCLS
jgi:hypothetical protein